MSPPFYVHVWADFIFPQVLLLIIQFISVPNSVKHGNQLWWTHRIPQYSFDSFSSTVTERFGLAATFCISVWLLLQNLLIYTEEGVKLPFMVEFILRSLPDCTPFYNWLLRCTVPFTTIILFIFHLLSTEWPKSLESMGILIIFLIFIYRLKG
jgi:hypothetical protein